jgi:hypothetical protein
MGQDDEVELAYELVGSEPPTLSLLLCRLPARPFSMPENQRSVC